MIAKQLNTPGASLYYELRGEGPVLLMINGGPADADQFIRVAEALADRYTVVIYDTRGNSRSISADQLPEQSIELESEDAHNLLAALTTEPAYVFGSSSGAMVGLELVRRHPRQVRTLVAHEPPVTELLPDAQRHRARAQEAYDAYVQHGVGAGMMTFLRNAGLEAPRAADDAPPSPPSPEAMARMARNAEHFLAHRIRAIAGYAPDVEELRASSSSIVVALGADTHDATLEECAHALANDLRTEPVTFPGGHGGFESNPLEFAESLDSAFSSDRASGG